MLRPRNENYHKGNFGRVAIVGGSVGMCGSITLCAMASLRTGSGLVYNFCKDEIFDIMQIKSLENIVVNINKLEQRLESLDAIAIGCGMGRNLEDLRIIERIIDNFNKPIVLDADALFLTKPIRDKVYKKSNIILTPHTGEFEYFTDIKVEDRLKCVKEFFNKTNSKNTLVLKGKNTIVADLKKEYVNNTGNDGLATAGSGDVLTGIILSLLGQNYDIFESAKIGVYLHGLSGDIASSDLGKDSLIASDIIKYLPEAIKKVRGI